MVRWHLLHHPVPKPHDLAVLLATLPAGQRRVMAAFVAEPWGRTRGETAAALGVRHRTERQHLACIRAQDHLIYAAPRGDAAGWGAVPGMGPVRTSCRRRRGHTGVRASGGAREKA